MGSATVGVYEFDNTPKLSYEFDNILSDNIFDFSFSSAYIS
jgi:hypothetical protein